jgi:hypothetical protein
MKTVSELEEKLRKKKRWKKKKIRRR